MVMIDLKMMKEWIEIEKTLLWSFLMVLIDLEMMEKIKYKETWM